MNSGSRNRRGQMVILGINQHSQLFRVWRPCPTLLCVRLSVALVHSPSDAKWSVEAHLEQNVPVPRNKTIQHVGQFDGLTFRSLHLPNFQEADNVDLVDICGGNPG